MTDLMPRCIEQIKASILKQIEGTQTMYIKCSVYEAHLLNIAALNTLLKDDRIWIYRISRKKLLLKPRSNDQPRSRGESAKVSDVVEMSMGQDDGIYIERSQTSIRQDLTHVLGSVDDDIHVADSFGNYRDVSYWHDIDELVP